MTAPTPESGTTPVSGGQSPDPVFSADGVELYHGDALDLLRAGVLRERTVDAVLTDPPYASGSRSEASRSSSGSMLRGKHDDVRLSTPIDLDQMTTTGFVWLMRSVAIEIYDSLVDGGSFLSFIDWRQWPQLVGALETANLRVQNMVVWDKSTMGLGNGFRNQHELVCHASKGVPNVADRGVPNVLSARKIDPKKIGHPSPKPTAVLERLLSVVAEPGQFVVDPFVGSGSTLIAARTLGVRAIGFEREPRHVDTAIARLNAERGLFDGASA